LQPQPSAESGPRPTLRTALIAVAIGIAPGLVFMAGLSADAFGTPAIHEVHSPGAVAVNATWVYSTAESQWEQGPPSQSPAGFRCQPLNGNGTAPCPPVDQAPGTLYAIGDFCGGYPKEPFRGVGQNVEYFPSSRTLVVHCYSAKPLLDVHGPQGVSMRVLAVLLAVPTSVLGPGTIKIDEDDRVEHLFGDQVNEYQVATAMIS